jgi:hypothetical protein
MSDHHSYSDKRCVPVLIVLGIFPGLLFAQATPPAKPIRINAVIAALFLVAMFCAPRVAAIPAYASGSSASSSSSATPSSAPNK